MLNGANVTDPGNLPTRLHSPVVACLPKWFNENMCGRYTERKQWVKLRKRFGVAIPDEIQHDLFKPRYNIAPTQDALVIRSDDGTPAMQMMRWGLIPFWAKDQKIGYKTINAMCETVAEKPAYRAAFKKRRCLVLADGFYEWRKGGTVKVPHWFTLQDGGPFAFAGLWETWPRPNEGDLHSFTIITTEPNALVSICHNRMPVILSPENYDTWLDPKTQDPDKLKAMLKPFPAEQMKATAVSSYVSNARNEGEKCIEPWK